MINSITSKIMKSFIKINFNKTKITYLINNNIYNIILLKLNQKI